MPQTIENRFGIGFVVRTGVEAQQKWTEISANDHEVDFLITHAAEDGDDGLCWTDWYECLMEHAVYAWDMSPNLLTEATIGLERTQQGWRDLAELLGHLLSKSTFNIVRFLFGAGLKTGRMCVKQEIHDPKIIIKHGLAKILAELMYGVNQKYNVDLLEVVASAYEEQNWHDVAEKIRAI